VVDGSARPGIPYRQASPGPFVETDGTATRYERFGTGGNPIVLVHGFVESTYAWRPVAKLLARDHVVYALDLRGFGYSEPRGPFGLDGWTRQLAAFLKVLAIHRPLLVGHSLGAAVIAELARREPAAVRGLVLADGDARKGGAGPPPILRNLIVDPFFAAATTVLTRWATPAEAILRRAWGPDHPPIGAAAIDPWLAPFRLQGSADALFAIAHQPLAGLDDAALASVRTPSLVLWGDSDTSVPLAAGRIAARLLRAPLVVLPRAGHLSMLADPAGFAAAVEHFDSTLR